MSSDWYLTYSVITLIQIPLTSFNHVLAKNEKSKTKMKQTNNRNRVPGENSNHESAHCQNRQNTGSKMRSKLPISLRGEGQLPI